MFLQHKAQTYDLQWVITKYFASFLKKSFYKNGEGAFSNVESPLSRFDPVIVLS